MPWRSSRLFILLVQSLALLEFLSMASQEMPTVVAPHRQAISSCFLTPSRAKQASSFPIYGTVMSNNAVSPSRRSPAAPRLLIMRREEHSRRSRPVSAVSSVEMGPRRRRRGGSREEHDVTRSEAVFRTTMLIASLGVIVAVTKPSPVQAQEAKEEEAVGSGGGDKGSSISSKQGLQTSPLPNLPEFRESAISSALAETLAVLVCHPIDTVKARVQNSQFASMSEAFTQTIEEEGVSALYSGLGTVLTIGTPAFMLYLGSYEVTKALLLSYASMLGLSESIAYFFAGIAAEAVSCLLYVPVDVIKERLQVQRSPVYLEQEGGEQDMEVVMAGMPRYQGTWDALRTILAKEGVGGIYKGYAASLLSFGPFSAFYFVFYEQFKVISAKLAGTGLSPSGGGVVEEQIPFLYILISAAVAGALSSWITNPLDLVRLRLQVQRGALASSSTTTTVVPYVNTWDGLSRIFSEEGGLVGLYRGSWARVAFFTPCTMISMSTYDYMKAFVHHLLAASP